jgi:hypothetical protein
MNRAAGKIIDSSLGTATKNFNHFIMIKKLKTITCAFLIAGRKNLCQQKNPYNRSSVNGFC